MGPAHSHRIIVWRIVRYQYVDKHMLWSDNKYAVLENPIETFRDSKGKKRTPDAKAPWGSNPVSWHLHRGRSIVAQFQRPLRINREAKGRVVSILWVYTRAVLDQ